LNIQIIINWPQDFWKGSRGLLPAYHEGLFYTLCLPDLFCQKVKEVCNLIISIEIKQLKCRWASGHRLFDVLSL